MITIYKYILDINDFQTVDMPEGAEILSVKIQPPKCSGGPEQLCMWVNIDTDKMLIPRRIRIFGTGNPMVYEHELKFIGTAQTADGYLVWHVFENIKEK